MSLELLNEAFQKFTLASKSLENYYDLLHKRIKHLTNELEKKNKQLQSALSEAERNKDFLNAILHSLEEAIIVVDPDERITMLNRSAEELFGIPLSEVSKMAFNELDFSIEDAGTESILTVKGKRYTVILSRSSVVDSNNNLRGTVILIKDITRLKELETQHERNQRLIAMGEMAAKIVHEIRNPLCSIEIFSTMLENELSDTPHIELAKGISSGINNLNNILTNMLLFAKPHKLTMKDIQLDKVVEDSLLMFDPIMKLRNIKLHKTLHKCEILGDPELLKQAFINIIMNAIQSMSSGGILNIYLEDDVKSIVLHIKDTGKGIDSDDLEKIFNPFFSRKDSGTGLGLTIASNIVQAHKGYIKVNSEKGIGSTFSLYFLKKEVHGLNKDKTYIGS
ncbi:MAG: PAS domain S-box protein [Nitrospirae bacterium]|nr:PAS domain S-box protein [Nitrospirota bacterium]